MGEKEDYFHSYRKIAGKPSISRFTNGAQKWNRFLEEFFRT
jgi:hypothetical protein